MSLYITEYVITNDNITKITQFTIEQAPLLNGETDYMGYETHAVSPNNDQETMYYQSMDLEKPTHFNINVVHYDINKKKDKKNDMESLTYVTVEHDAYFERQKHRRIRDERLDEFRKWLTSLFIGVCTGVMAFCVHWMIENITHLKYKWMETYLHFQAKETIHLGYLIFLSCNLLLVTISLIIIFIWKPAGGSGLPEVKGYLNGTRIPKAFNIITLITKVISMICSVSAQLPAGPGAIISFILIITLYRGPFHSSWCHDRRRTRRMEIKDFALSTALHAEF